MIHRRGALLLFLLPDSADAEEEAVAVGVVVVVGVDVVVGGSFAWVCFGLLQVASFCFGLCLACPVLKRAERADVDRKHMFLYNMRASGSGPDLSLHIDERNRRSL